MAEPWFKTWNNEFFNYLKLTGLIYNDALKDYGVKIESPPIAAGQDYWRVMGVHILTDEENVGKHNGYCDVFGPDGNRLYETIIKITNVNSGKVTTTRIDKGANEPGTNFPIWSHDNLTAEVDRDGLPSQRVAGLRTSFDDTGTGNTRYHFSYYFLFQRATMGESKPPDPEPPPPDPTPDPAYTITSKVVYDITNDKGDFITQTHSLHTARQVVAALVLFKASSKDSRLEEYVKAIEKWNRGER